MKDQPTVDRATGPLDTPTATHQDGTSAGGDTFTYRPPAPPQPPPDVPGYELLGELGRGGMGVVYHARQAGLNRPAAVKMLLGRGADDPMMVVRFLAEAEAVAAVKHPNVVEVYAFSDVGGCPFLVMEYLGGGSLSARIRQAGRLTPADAVRLVEKLARGVQAAHDLGVVHRDLKPGNVLFDAAGEPKVTDFGLAKRGTGGGLTETNAVMGTPVYMSPEQAAGRTKFVGPAADLYALGVILYECLTGTVPFTGDSPLTVVRRVIDERPEPPRARVPDLPRDLDLICLKCLEKDPRARYQSAAALADDLRRFAAGQPVSVRPPSLAAVVRQWAKEQFGSAGWAVAGGVASGLVGGANVFLDMFGRKVPLAQAQFEHLTGSAADAAQPVSDVVLNLVEIGMYLLVPVLLFLTAALVRPKSRSADLAAGLLTGLISAVTFFLVAYGWWAVYSVCVRPAVPDLATLGDPSATDRATLAAKVHNDLLVRIPWAVVSGMILALALTLPIATLLVGSAGGLIRRRGMRPVVLPLFLEVGLPGIVFAVNVFLLLNRALWYGMRPQHPLVYAGLLALCALALWAAWGGKRWWWRAAAQAAWMGYCVVTKVLVLYEYD